MYQTKFLEFWFEWKAPFVPVPEVFVLERADSISIWQYSNRVIQRVQDNSTGKECPKRENKALQKRLAKHGFDNDDI